MDKILITTLVVLLNTGLCAVFIFFDRLKMALRFRIWFCVSFLVLHVIWELLKLEYLDIMRLTASLFVLFSVKFIVLKFDSLIQKNKTVVRHPMMNFIEFIFLPIFVIFFTILQIRFLYTSFP